MATRALFDGDPVVIVYPDGHELLVRPEQVMVSRASWLWQRFFYGSSAATVPVLYSPPRARIDGTGFDRLSHRSVRGRLTDARAFLHELAGQTISTLSGRPNVVLGVEGGDVLVGTQKSPQGEPVPIASVQDAIDRLEESGEVPINVESVGYRSAFVGAVLAQLPGAEIRKEPQRVRLNRTNR